MSIRPTLRRHGRRGALAASAFALVTGTTVAMAGSASAAFSPYVNVKYQNLGDCTAYAGAQYMGSNGSAVGAAQLPCNYRHASTTVTVHLVRGLPNQPYSTVSSRTTTFYNSYGFGSSQLNTGAVCGPAAWWYTQVDYTVAGLGSGSVTNTPQWYDPCGPDQ